MTSLASVIERHGAAYLASVHDSGHLRPEQRRALAALRRCRTQLAATCTARCSNDDCAAVRVLPHSCSHRHCPHCQAAEGQQWIERQRRQPVPGAYFLVTFTLPAELRALATAHQREVYDALMNSAWATLRQFALNHGHLYGTPGAVAVLHTHNRALGYHPHVHLAMPAAALDERVRLWRQLPREQGYLFSQRALAAVFRGKLIAALKSQGLQLPVVLPERWVVHCKRLDHGDPVIVYLGRYLYRGVIQEKDILRCDDTGVTYRWRDGKTGQFRQRTRPRRGVPAAGDAARAAARAAPGAQLRLAASERQAAAGAAEPAGVRAGGAAVAAAGAALPLLRCADALRAETCAAGAGASAGSADAPGHGTAC